MTKYQMLFIIENDLEEDAKVATIEKYSALIEKLGGTISSVDKWGTKAYAYPINHKKEGYYVLVKFEATSEVPAEIERQMKINDSIVRQMITRQC